MTTQATSGNTLFTISGRINAANDVLNDLANSNTYVLIGVQQQYSDNDSLLPIPNNSQDYFNNIYRNALAIKLLSATNMNLMVPRIDWANNTVYDFWDDTVDMYSTVSYTELPGTINVANSRTINGTSTYFNSNISQGQFVYIPGDGLTVLPQTLQVTDIFSNTSMNVNTAVVGNVISNSIYLVTNTAPFYANTFYVRNSYDQVFICLNNNGGVASIDMPMLSLGGDLPTDSYIITSDGYYWKYLYSIPSGNKQMFFTTDWMPVYSDETVVSSAVAGRIDVILITDTGSGYNQNSATNSAAILIVTGDGTGANITAVVNSTGSITGVNILDGGSGYTEATITANTGITGNGASFRVIIGPQGGHGFNPVQELGASTLMISQQLIGNEANTIPTGVTAGVGQFEFHQIGLLQEPILTSGNIASNINYSMVSTVSVQALPTGKYYSIDETVYQGTSANQTFSGVVVYWDDVNDLIWINNIQGTFTSQAPIYGTIQTSPVTAFVLTEPDIVPYTGNILYINNVLPIVRGSSQTEQIQAIMEF